MVLEKQREDINGNTNMTMNWTNLLKVLNEFGKRFVTEYKEKLDEEDVNATYQLSNSVEYYIDIDNQAFEVSIHLEDYWRYIEEGRKAGKWPPLKAIKDWVIKKPILPRPLNNGKIPKPEQLALLIQRKIYQEGIEPRPLFEMTLQEVMDEFDERLYDAITLDVANAVDEALEIL